ncbi:hypothetical protein EDB92DRAFT_410865 [Lactarius akahatsu]|uniref:C2 domain-containing protein n=1 Tax=Lactarius akahatsu TaxID=416441 RepID=A0AAD4LHN3_9AGAM|nr:hypothetical protein EDB92DRAFT_410865 [Lactarius akahatsu]
MVAAARNLERGKMKMSSNFPVPSASGISGRGHSTQIAESQGNLSRVEVIVLRAHDLPRIKKQLGSKKRFYVTVTNHTTTKKTESVQVDGQTVHWNQKLGAFSIPRSSHLILHLYEKRRIYADVLIGTQEIPVETQKEVRFVLTYDGGQAGQSTQPVTPRVTLYLTVVVSPVENALHDAKNAITTINLSNKWEGTLERIKWVMDTVSPVAELHPIAKMAHGLLSAIPRTLLEQFQRDYNIQTLLVAMHDGFSFANQEARFKAIRRDSRQAQILTLMLQHVCNCCDFIQSYAKDSHFWERMLKNAGGQANKKIEDFRATLLEQRKAFLDEATITTEITALQILDDVGIISADVGRISSRLDGMATQLKWMSSQASDAELDRKIGEIPYGTGSRFTPDKGCLTGTRTVFLDFVVNWVNDPTSERCLILFGQAGTGKSSIAHEIARRFHKIHRLTSSFIFLRKEQSKREAYHRLHDSCSRSLRPLSFL